MADNKTEGQDYGFQSDVNSAITNGAQAGLESAPPVNLKVTPSAPEILTNPVHASGPALSVFGVLGKGLGMVNLANDAVSVGTPLYLSLETGLQGNEQASDSYLTDATVQAGGVAGQATGILVGAKEGAIVGTAIGLEFGIAAPIAAPIGAAIGAGLGALGGSPAGQSATKYILDNSPTQLDNIPATLGDTYTLNGNGYAQANGKWYWQTQEYGSVFHVYRSRKTAKKKAPRGGLNI